MSTEVETPTAAPEAAEAPTTEAPVEQTGAPEAPKPAAPERAAETEPAVHSKEGYRKRVSERYERLAAAREEAAGAESTEGEAGDEAGTAPTVDALGRKHDPKDGKFLPENEEGQPAADAQQASEASEDEADAGDQPAEGYVRVPLPDDHPLREQGLTYLETRAEQENAIRAAINNPVRRSEVEAAQNEARQLKQRLEALEQQRVMGEVETRTRQEALSDPEIRARYQDIAQTYGAEEAEAYLAGKLRPKMDEALQKQNAERQREQVQQTAVQFATQMHQQARTTLDPKITALPNFQPLVSEALTQYGNMLDLREQAGQPVEYSEEEFFQSYMLPRLVADKGARKVLLEAQARQRQGSDAERDRLAKAKADAEAKKREEERLKDAARRHAGKHPMGRIPSNARTGVTSTDNAEEQPVTAGMSRGDIKRTMRERARDRG